jgi:hypothetical protein
MEEASTTAGDRFETEFQVSPALSRQVYAEYTWHRRSGWLIGSVLAGVACGGLLFYATTRPAALLLLGALIVWWSSWLRGYRSAGALPLDSPVRLAADASGLHLATKTAARHPRGATSRRSRDCPTSGCWCVPSTSSRSRSPSPRWTAPHKLSSKPGCGAPAAGSGRLSCASRPIGRWTISSHLATPGASGCLRMSLAVAGPGTSAYPLARWLCRLCCATRRKDRRLDRLRHNLRPGA